MNKILRVANANKAILSLVNEDTKRNLSTTASRNVKVDVCGASGGIGQPLSLLLKQEGKIYRAFGGQSLNFGMERTYYSTKKEEPAAVHAEAPKKEVQVVTYRPWYKSFFVRGYVPVFLYNQVLDRAFAAENRATKAEDELGASTKIIWRATSRAAIEYFIDRHGKGAIVNYKNIPEAPTVVSWYERARLIREEKLNWIFKNRANDLQVSLLMKAINASQQFTSLEEFSSYLSMAYDELSDQLKTRLVNPDVGAYDFQKIVISPEANQAIKLFMSRFDFGDVVVRKK